MTIVSSDTNKAPIQIHQDMNISVIYLEAGASVNYELADDRQAYLIQIEGNGQVNGLDLNKMDAAEIAGEDITLQTKEASHYILFDMGKE